MKLNTVVAAIVAGTFLANIASAHPGHSPTDVAAQVAQPLAGADHFAAFVALTTVLLMALRSLVQARVTKTEKARR